MAVTDINKKDYSTSFMRRSSAPRSNPLPFYFRLASIDKRTPPPPSLYTPSLELWIPFVELLLMYCVTDMDKQKDRKYGGKVYTASGKRVGCYKIEHRG